MQAESICEHLEGLWARGAGIPELLAQSVILLHNSEPRFHWTGIYELRDDGALHLGPFVGAATDHVCIAVGNGVCGSAVAERRNKNIPDVSREPNYLACSSQTCSELVVLIRAGDRIFAQIDIDSHDFDAFDAAAEAKVVRVADCLARCYALSPEAPRAATAAGPR